MLSLLKAFENQILMTKSESGVTAECPFPDAMPPTVLVQMIADQPHPTYGSGVMFLKKLPNLPHGRLSGITLANLLNLGEMDPIDSGYGFGAWCLDVQNEKGTAYAGFLPALMFKPNLLYNLMVSLAAKARWAHFFLDFENDAAEVGKWQKLQIKLLGGLSKSAKAC